MAYLLDNLSPGTHSADIVYLPAKGGKVDMLNTSFHPVFSMQIPMKLGVICDYFSNLFSKEDSDMPEIQITKNGVLKLLKTLNVPKAAGPDVIRILKELAYDLSRSNLTLLFRTSLDQQSLSDVWKQTDVTPI